MPTLKALPLERWMLYEYNRRNLDICCGKSYAVVKSPVFSMGALRKNTELLGVGKNGCYYKRPYIKGHSPFCWFEIDGKAWLDNSRMFEISLKRMNHTYLRPEVIAALKIIEKEKLPKTDLLELLHDDSYFKYLRRLSRGLDSLKFRKKIKKILSKNL